MPKNKDAVNRDAPLYSEQFSKVEDGCFGMGGYQVNAHPDGCPWQTPCVRDPRCAYSRGFPKPGPAQIRIEEGNRFFCVHRKDGNHHRVCAGYHNSGDGEFFLNKKEPTDASK